VSTAIVRIVVTDSNVLINLMHVSRLDFCGRLPGHEFVVPDHVREEINDPDQRLTLDAALNAGMLKLESITELDDLAVFADLIVHIGRGEAACIAIASKKGWSIASDEKRRFRREALARVGSERLLGTAELFVLAIKAGLITVDEADADKLTLEGLRFKMLFASFRELVK
jgi:predicted nucleic acid-binding protein